MTITVILPWPSVALSPNSRNHWAKNKAVTVARQVAKIETLAQAPGARLPEAGPLSVSWVFCPPTRREYDTDNMAARSKAYLDGVADALGFNDKRVSQTHSARGERCAGGRVEMRIDVVAK